MVVLAEFRLCAVAACLERVCKLFTSPRFATLRAGRMDCSNCSCVKLTGIVFMVDYLWSGFSFQDALSSPVRKSFNQFVV